jgi:hypothetical protein
MLLGTLALPEEGRRASQGFHARVTPTCNWAFVFAANRVLCALFAANLPRVSLGPRSTSRRKNEVPQAGAFFHNYPSVGFVGTSGGDSARTFYNHLNCHAPPARRTSAAADC